MATLVHEDARLIDARTGVELRGYALRTAIDAAADVAKDGYGLVAMVLPRELEPVLAFLGMVKAGRPVALFDGDNPRLRASVVENFGPSLVVGVEGAPPQGYRACTYLRIPAWSRIEPVEVLPHPSLALMLMTSGSTGSPKGVRLSFKAVASNAAAIAEGLGITSSDVAVTTLPLIHSYGMSVFTSHLTAGATVVLSERTLVDAPFWDDVTRFGVTSLAGVPYQYQMLQRLKFDPERYPTIHTLTQAGGRLQPDVAERFGRLMAVAGGRMVVMYGQTEATARMTILPAEALMEKLGSVGLPIPGGRVRIDGGEVVFEGPSVMMGYAACAGDLALGDELRGVLRTGDLGRLDDDGYLYITGRSGRFAKVFGERVNLDDVERICAERGFTVAALAVDAGLMLVVEVGEGTGDGTNAPLGVMGPRSLGLFVAQQIGVHSTGLVVRNVEKLPRTGSGKIEYPALSDS